RRTKPANSLFSTSRRTRPERRAGGNERLTADAAGRGGRRVEPGGGIRAASTALHASQQGASGARAARRPPTAQVRHHPPGAVVRGKASDTVGTNSPPICEWLWGSGAGRSLGR